MDIGDIKKVGVAGAGVMGSSVAEIISRYGYNVVLYNHRIPTLEKAKDLIALSQNNLVESGEITRKESEELVSRIRFSTDLQDFKDVDIVSESIVENLDIKLDFWSTLSRIVREDAVLTTNTSGLSISKIAQAVYKPERFAGMHWFNPPYIIPLIEVIKGENTSEEVVDLICKISHIVGKKAIVAKKDAKGFIFNRLQLAILREAMYIVESGIADKEDVDNAVKYGLGFRYASLGPFEVCDLGGLDTFYHIAEYLFPDLCNSEEVLPLLADCYNAGNYGVKTKKGFYDYSNGKDNEAIKNRDESFLKLYRTLYK